MPRKTNPSAGQIRKRGRHKKAKSRETSRWLGMVRAGKALTSTEG